MSMISVPNERGMGSCEHQKGQDVPFLTPPTLLKLEAGKNLSQFLKIGKRRRQKVISFVDWVSNSVSSK